MITLNMHHQSVEQERITMTKKTYQNTMLGLLVIFGITALFSVMAFFMAMVALCK